MTEPIKKSPIAFTAIAAVDKNWAIGCGGKLLLSIPDDMKFFRSVTLNKTVVMGRKTLESFPDKRPLLKRTNIVLSGSMDPEVSEINEDTRLIITPDILSLLDILSGEDTVFVIGGGSVYKALLPYTKKALITYVRYGFKEADTYFPNLDKDQEWKLLSESKICEYEMPHNELAMSAKKVKYSFRTYERVNEVR